MEKNCLSSILVLTAIFAYTSIAGFAQSGKTVQVPTPTSSPSRSLSRPSDSISGKNLHRGDEETYKLLFLSEYTGKLGYLPEEQIELERGRYALVNGFITQISEAGNEGYRIVSLSDNNVAIVKLEEGQYEYNWFETTSSVHFAKAGFQEKLSLYSELGFTLVKHNLLSANCTLTTYEFSTNFESCSYLDFFLLEKEKGSKKTVDQVVVNSFPGWGARPSVEMAGEIEEKLAEGFYPVRAISKFEILLEKAKDKNDILDDKPDVQIVRSGWGTGNLQKKVNELAKQGYRLAVANNGIAVMYRNSETKGKPVSYIWLRADKKKFEKELAKLQQQGARYSYVYPNEHGTKNSLIFETSLDGKRKGAEFKVLEFDFDTREDKNEGKVYITLTPLAKDSIKKMNELAKEGYVVRDLFKGDKVSVILERVR